MTEKTWLAASYHFPSTYSIRVPMSSETHARTLPTPGPATVRLALLRASLEVLGVEATQHLLFPHLVACSLFIRAPEQLAITQQQLRGYKRSPNKEDRTEVIQGSLQQREMIHAKGEMTIYAQLPTHLGTQYMTLFQAISYWGQSSSLTTCLDVSEQEPKPQECLMPLATLAKVHPQGMLQPWFSALVTEFRDENVTWKEIMSPGEQSNKPALQLDVAVWPLKLIQSEANGKHFHRLMFF